MTQGGLKSKVKFCECWRSSGVEQLPCKQWVGGSNPPASASHFKGLQSEDKRGDTQVGQRGQTVNLLAHAFGGSNPPLPTTRAGTQNTSGNSSAVERQPSKLGVAGSNPVSRSSPGTRGSTRWASAGCVEKCAHVAQLAERVLGKDEVSGSIPDMGSISKSIATANGRV